MGLGSADVSQCPSRVADCYSCEVAQSSGVRAGQRPPSP